ncbi:MAG TPA: LapA family protein [Candidatus Nanoarchaeia archaeon]|nr:LapA family protein [Candidatus Nanoarchaeia archaeon]
MALNESLLTIPGISATVQTINTVMNMLSVLIGGFFGIAVIAFIFEIYRLTKIQRTVRSIKHEISTLHKKIDALAEGQKAAGRQWRASRK